MHLILVGVLALPCTASSNMATTIQRTRVPPRTLSIPLREGDIPPEAMQFIVPYMNTWPTPADCCANGGTCVHGENGTTKCLCPAAFSGPACLDDVDECRLRRPCGRFSVCTNMYGSFRCDCMPGFQLQAHLCVREITCEEGPCLNGGSCVTREDLTDVCYCKIGFRGRLCEIATPFYLWTYYKGLYELLFHLRARKERHVISSLEDSSPCMRRRRRRRSGALPGRGCGCRRGAGRQRDPSLPDGLHARAAGAAREGILPRELRVQAPEVRAGRHAQLAREHHQGVVPEQAHEGQAAAHGTGLAVRRPALRRVHAERRRRRRGLGSRGLSVRVSLAVLHGCGSGPVSAGTLSPVQRRRSRQAPVPGSAAGRDARSVSPVTLGASDGGLACYDDSVRLPLHTVSRHAAAADATAAPAAHDVDDTDDHGVQPIPAVFAAHRGSRAHHPGCAYDGAIGETAQLVSAVQD
ncbi:uncharacterized protein [Dermacentor albipictus]|uniref:uncharacterized protein isoform X2 n=1 Tax=Dermacentor albipictus TaxID=60249 RepID=UPI0038FCC1C3